MVFSSFVAQLRTLPQQYHLGDGNPFTMPTAPAISRMSGSSVFEMKFSGGNSSVNASCCVGGPEGSSRLDLDIGTLTAKTSKAGRPSQQDGYYLCSIILSGMQYHVIAIVDGMGGQEGGDIAASAFLQGVHAAVMGRASSDLIPTPNCLFFSGVEALKAQRKYHEKNNADAVASLMVVNSYGEVASASAGDTVQFFLRSTDGRYQVRTHTPVCETFSRNVVTKSVAMTSPENPPDLCKTDIQRGDIAILGTDGLFDRILPPDSKLHLCPGMDVGAMLGTSRYGQDFFRKLLDEAQRVSAEMASGSVGRSGGRFQDSAERLYNLAHSLGSSGMDNITAVTLYFDPRRDFSNLGHGKNKMVHPLRSTKSKKK